MQQGLTYPCSVFPAFVDVWICNRSSTAGYLHLKPKLLTHSDVTNALMEQTLVKSLTICREWHGRDRVKKHLVMRLATVMLLKRPLLFECTHCFCLTLNCPLSGFIKCLHLMSDVVGRLCHVCRKILLAACPAGLAL